MAREKKPKGRKKSSTEAAKSADLEDRMMRYRKEANCPKCNAPFKENDVKLLGSRAKCLYCDSIFNLEKKIP